MIPSPSELRELARSHPWRTLALALLLGAMLSSLGLWLSLPDVSGLSRGWPDTTAYMELRIRQAVAEGRSLDLRYRPVPLDRIPDHLQDAVRVAEDAGFYGHQGVDWEEVRAALSEAWEEERLPRGASTITQQLARNLYLSPARTPWRKLREYFVARRLEEALSKRRILELYLNVIELGDGVFGVDAAARRYFAIPVEDLSRSQAVALAASIPAPRTHNPATATEGHRWRVRGIRGRLAAIDSLRRVGEAVPPPPPELPVPDTAPPVDELEADTAAGGDPVPDTTAVDTSSAGTGPVIRRQPRSR